MTFSKRTEWNTAPNALAQMLERVKASSDFIDLTVSNPTACGFQYLTSDLLEGFQNLENLNYRPDAHGLLEARQAVVNYYARKNIPLSPDQIFITANTSEAYTFVFKLLADAGDTVLAPAPGYPLIEYLAGINDLSLERYPLTHNNGWHTDLAVLSQKINRPLKALMLVHPANPTGNYVGSSERQQMIHLCSPSQTPIISDEVFFDYSWVGAAPAESFAANNAGLTFTLSGISKILGLPQMKISWIVVTGPEALKTEALHRLEIIADTYLSASTPAQTMLPVWFNREAMIRNEILTRLQENRKILAGFFGGDSKIKLLEGGGGWTSVLELPAEEQDESWALHFLENFHTALHPGYLFDMPAEKPYLVLSLLTPPALLAQALNRFSL